MTDSQANAALPTEATEPTPTPAITTPPQKQKIKMNRSQYDGAVGKIYKIWLLNFFMKIITLGIYSFWGKTRLRKYIASSFILGGDRFEYTGTGKELFLGFLKAVPFIILVYAPYITATIIAGEEAAWPAIFLLPFLYIVPMAIFMALRYRLSRTTWRGVRGSLTGSAIKYGNLSIKRTFINMITLGIFIPYSDMEKYKFIVEHAYFGNVKAEFKTSAKSLIKTHIITLFLMIPTLGFSRLWYTAALQRAKMNGLFIGDLRFKSNVTGVDMLKNTLINLLILVCTLGLGTPFIINRNMKFMARHNVIGGDLDTSQIMQAKGQKASVGEGLDDFMGLDGGFLG
ncbi:MAG: DUF898 family protein [Alphaproteobacteria bacterium]